MKCYMNHSCEVQWQSQPDCPTPQRTHKGKKSALSNKDEMCLSVTQFLASSSGLHGVQKCQFKSRMQISGSSWYVAQITTQPLGPSWGKILRMAQDQETVCNKGTWLKMSPESLVQYSSALILEFHQASFPKGSSVITRRLLGSRILEPPKGRVWIE